MIVLLSLFLRSQESSESWLCNGCCFFLDILSGDCPCLVDGSSLLMASVRSGEPWPPGSLLGLWIFFLGWLEMDARDGGIY